MSAWGPLIALAFVSLALPVGWHKWVKASLGQATVGQRFGSAARFFYFVGLPYLAAISGLVPPRFLGLKGLENFVSINLTGGWAVTVTELQKAGTLFLLECLVDGSVMIWVGLVALLIVAGLRLGLARLEVDLAIGPQASLLDTSYDCLHWAFYRGIFWLITGDLYLGVVWGLGWVMVEGALWIWSQKDGPVQKLHLLTKAIILILTSTIFFYSPNLWLIWLMHAAMVAILALRFSGRLARQTIPT